MFAMNDHKLSKSHIHNDTRSTINETDKQFFRDRDRDRSDLELKIEKAESLKKKIKDLDKTSVDSPEFTTNWDRRNRLESELRTLEALINSIKSGESELQYLFRLGKFLDTGTGSEANTNRPHTHDQSHWTKVSARSAGEKYEKYLEKVFDRNPSTSGSEYDALICENCNTDMLYDEQAAQVSCTECGLCRDYQDPRDTSYREGVCIVTPYAYKRINHFKEWLAQIQAKESTEIPRGILMDIQAELKKERIHDKKDVTHEKIRKYLKKLRHNKYYEHIPAILNRITGEKAPKFSSEIEERLVSMFSQIQEPFQKHCKIIAPKRKNFLSYSYTLRQMCIVLGREDLAQNFALLKSREKNFVQDQIWKAICQDVDWPFNRTV